MAQTLNELAYNYKQLPACHKRQRALMDYKVMFLYIALIA